MAEDVGFSETDVGVNLDASAHWLSDPGQALPAPEPQFSHLHDGNNGIPTSWK